MQHPQAQITAYETALLYEEARERRNQGNPSGALARYRRLLELTERAGQHEMLAAVKQEIGEMYHQACDTFPAREWYEQARAAYDLLGDQRQVAWLTFRLAEVAQLRGELSEAETLFREAGSQAEAVCEPVLQARIGAGLGLLLCAHDRFEEGFAECVSALRTARVGDCETAAQIAGAVRAWMDRIGRVRYRRLVHAATEDQELRGLLIP